MLTVSHDQAAAEGRNPAQLPMHFQAGWEQEQTPNPSPFPLPLPPPPGLKTARCILDDRCHWFSTVPGKNKGFVFPLFGMVNGRVFPTLTVSAPVSWFGLSSQKLQPWPCLSDANGSFPLIIDSQRLEPKKESEHSSHSGNA